MAQAGFDRSRVRAASWLAPLLLVCALGSAVMAQALAQPRPAPAAPPGFATAQAAFEALPEAERKAIQEDLIWAGQFSAAASGSFGPLTFRAINAAKAASRGDASGVLTPAERRALAERAAAARAEVGFQIVDDPRTGVRIGIPAKVLPKREAASAGGGRWQSADGKVTLDTSAPPPGDRLEEIFERATNASVPGRKITYKLLRPDFFVISGETATGKFYRRLGAGPEGLRGFSIGYDKALAPTIDRLVIAIANSFEPFPSGPTPPPAPPAPRPSERFGVGLFVSSGLVLTSAGVVEPCKGLRVAGKPARLRLKDEASGLAVLESAGSPLSAGLRGEALAEGEAVVLLGYAETAGQRAAVALPGLARRIGVASSVSAPLQPGQSGAPLFDRQGRLAGLVTANPSDRYLVAGVAPQSSHRIAEGAALQSVLAKAGAVLPAAAAGTPELSTGAIAAAGAPATALIACGL